eukprot:GEMP01001758.1.p1 GENE.GEMP01001758.1~~GEMP01001758.1.p1  ORF type:complete len:1435 (+),score=366.11 GEMP01001758.1:56-4360(+)
MASVEEWLAQTSKPSAPGANAAPAPDGQAATPLGSPRRWSKSVVQDNVMEGSMGLKLTMTEKPREATIDEKGLRMLRLKSALKAQERHITAAKEVLAPIVVEDDGLYRSPANLSIKEPWNHERLLLQMSREADAREGSDSASNSRIRREMQQMVGNAEDIVAVSFVVPRSARGFVPVAEDTSVEASSFRCEREQLKSSKMHTLEVSVDDIRLSAVPLAGDLFSKEDELADVVVQAYEEYKEKAKIDIDVMDQQHIQLVAFGKTLQQECTLARAQQGGKANRGVHETRWNCHVSERRKLRRDRLSAEKELADAQTRLYRAWQDLRGHRNSVKFTSTRWKLEATEVKKEPRLEHSQREEEINAEVEEIMMDAWPQEIDVHAERERLRNSSERRPPGASMYRFQLLQTQQITQNLDASIPYHREEIVRRAILDSGNILLTIALIVNGERLHTLPALPLRSANSWSIDASVGAFRIALHTFPTRLQLDVSLCRARVLTFIPFPSFLATLAPRWRQRCQVDVSIPNARVAHATHRAPQRHTCRFPRSTNGLSGSVGLTIGWAPGSGLESRAVTSTINTAEAQHSGAGGSTSSQGGGGGGARTMTRAYEVVDPLDPLAHGSAPMLASGDVLSNSYGGMSSTSASGTLFDTQVLRGYTILVHNSAIFADARRIKRLIARHTTPGPIKPIPIFDRELRTEVKTGADADSIVVNVPRHTEKDDTVEEFVRKIQERTKTVSAVHSSLVLRSIVKEYEGLLLWFGQVGAPRRDTILDIFKPARSLKPSGKPRDTDPKALTANIHVIVAKVINAPLRITNSHEESYSKPEIIVSIAFENLDGDLLERDTAPAVWGRNPDINRHCVLPLASGKRPEVILSPDTLELFLQSLHFNVFDEVITSHGAREWRYLGSFELPWATLYENDCKVSGTFCVKTPEHLLGYVNKGDNMYISLNCTLDKKLVLAERKQTRIVPGREPRMLLAGISKWIDMFDVNPLGIDIDGRSRLICRFITPQAPPEHVCNARSDPQAIEKAARYVALIPFLTDKQMFDGKVADLWCTTAQFFDIRCGDWEEHAILLCNYFNYIDGERRALDPSHNVHSYCAEVRALPDGDAMYVLRRDCTAGHCELWNATTAQCYFFPSTRVAYVPMRERLKAARDSVVKRISRNSQLNDATNRANQEKVLESDAAHCPVNQIRMIFNEENVWANVRLEVVQFGSQSQHVVKSDGLDIGNRAIWQPLFEMPSKRFGLLSSTCNGLDRSKALPTEPDKIASIQIHPVAYTNPDKDTAESTAQRLEDYLWQKIYHVRGNMQRKTRSNASMRRKLADVCGILETYKMAHRDGAADAPMPLKERPSDHIDLSSSSMLEAHIQRIMDEFHHGIYRGYHVYGVPLNFPLCGFDILWRKVANTNLMAMGDDDAEYSLGVRVFPYPNRTYSIWVFIVCASRE